MKVPPAIKSVTGRAGAAPGAARSGAGFTIVELVLVITLIGILATVAGPRFFARSTFDARAYRDELASALRYAQKVAVASGCPVRVSVTASSYALTQQQVLAGHCDPSDTVYPTPVILTDGETMAGNAPADISVTPALDFVYLPTGSTTLGVDQSFDVSGRSVTLEAQSGLVSTP